MTSAPYALGGTRLPLPLPGPEALTDQDPGRDRILAVVKAALLAELAGRWPAAVDQTSLAGRLPVESAFPHEPTEEFIQTNKAKLPALFVYSAPETTFSDHTLMEKQGTREIAVDYVLGPLKSDEMRRVGDVFRVFSALLSYIVEERGHEAFLAGPGNRPRNVLTGDATGFSDLRLRSVATGKAKFSEDSPTTYAAASATLAVQETTENGVAGLVFEGGEFSADVEEIEDLIHDDFEIEAEDD